MTYWNSLFLSRRVSGRAVCRLSTVCWAQCAHPHEISNENSESRRGVPFRTVIVKIEHSNTSEVILCHIQNCKRQRYLSHDCTGRSQLRNSTAGP